MFWSEESLFSGAEHFFSTKLHHLETAMSYSIATG